MTLDPKILLSDEQANQDWPLLRLEIAKVMTPGRWKHDLSTVYSSDYDNMVEDRICLKCKASEFHNQTDGPCSVILPITGPLEVCAEKLVKMCGQDQLGAAVDDYLSGTDARGLDYRIWWIFEATPAEHCLLALEGGKLEGGKR